MLNELRIAFRSMCKARGYTVAALSVIALCIGANTAIFSIVNGVLWRPLPFATPNRLVSLTEKVGKLASSQWPFSTPDYLFLEQQTKSFGETAAYTLRDWELSGVERPDRITGLRTEPQLFSLLGVAPRFGRTFTKEESDHARQVAVLSYSYWLRVFGGKRDAVGRTIYLDRQPYTVIGVMPRSFVFPLRQAGYNGTPADVYLPISWTAFERKGFGYMFNKSVIARMKPGVTPARASAELNLLLKRFQSHYPAGYQSYPGFYLSGTVIPYRDQVTGNLQRGLLVLLGAIGLVLLIGCANVANLLLARSVDRRREFAVRSALGANKLDLVRQNLLENLMLSFAGGALGLGLATWLIPLLVRISPVQVPRLEEIGVDGWALLFTFAICCISPLLFGLAPALETSRVEIAATLREGGRSGTRSTRQRTWMSATVVTQYALTLVLLTAAGLLMRSFLRLMHVNPGFQTEHVLSMAVKLPTASYKTASQILSFYDTLVHNTQSLPAVQKAGAISDLPLTPSDEWGVAIEGKSPDSGVPRSILLSWVSGDAMQALGMKLLHGRLLTGQDTRTAPSAVVVNEAMARKAWPDQNPIGKRIGLGGKPDKDSDWKTVVGVIADVRQGLSNLDTRPQVFQTQAQASPDALANTVGSGLRGMHLIIRSQGDPAFLTSAVRALIARQDPALPITEIETLDRYVSGSINSERYNVYLIGLFAALALALAIVGIAGTLWYGVTQRTNELGVRMALGGDRGDVVRLVLKDAFQLALIGIALGLAVSLAATRFLSTLLYQTSRFDTLTFIIVPIALVLTTFAASLVPAWRATRIDPMIALRAE